MDVFTQLFPEQGIHAGFYMKGKKYIAKDRSPTFAPIWRGVCINEVHINERSLYLSPAHVLISGASVRETCPNAFPS